MKNSIKKNLTLDDILSGETNNFITLLSLIVYHLFDSCFTPFYLLYDKTFVIWCITYIYFQLHYFWNAIFARADFKVLLILYHYCSLCHCFLDFEQLQQDITAKFINTITNITTYGHDSDELFFSSNVEQKQPPEMLRKKMCSQKFLKFHRSICVGVSLGGEWNFC